VTRPRSAGVVSLLANVVGEAQPAGELVVDLGHVMKPVFAEIGLTDDDRLADALDLVEENELADGG
jgi:hypothetical protein